MVNLEYMLPLLLVCSIAAGCIAIVGASYHWVRNKMFGLAGIILSIVGLSLLGGSLWVSLHYATESRPADDTAFQRAIEDTNDKTLATIRESNKQVTDRLQQSVKQLHENQDLFLSDVQSHILAIRTALSPRPASAHESTADSAPISTSSRQSGKKRPKASAR